MSKNYSDCDIVLELLPLYLDQRTGEESNAFVQKHLAGCSECRAVHCLMSADLSECKGSTMRQIGKKGRRKWRHLSHTMKRTIILVAGLVGYLCLMVGCVALAIWLLVYS